MESIKKLIAKYRKQHSKYGMGSTISYSEVIADLQSLLDKSTDNNEIPKKRILNVKKVTKRELQTNWEVTLPAHWPSILFVRCNSKGEVKWDSTLAYQPTELVLRGNYKIIQ